MSNYDLIDRDFDLTNVKAYLFKPSGKYQGEVILDFTGIFDGEYIDHRQSTLAAYRHKFGTTLNGRHLVVINHPYGFPVMITHRRPVRPATDDLDPGH